MTTQATLQETIAANNTRTPCGCIVTNGSTTTCSCGDNCQCGADCTCKTCSCKK